MSTHAHKRTIYACGHPHSQCRCIVPNKPVEMLAEPCDVCRPQWEREHPEGKELKTRQEWRAAATEWARLFVAAADAGEVSAELRAAAVDVIDHAHREVAIERELRQTEGFRQINPKESDR